MRLSLTGRRCCALITLDEDVSEIEELARSAGYEIVYEIIQRRARPDPNTFLGRGKIIEVQKVLDMRGVDAILINGDLKPSHHYILENSLKSECVDRVRLILEIFMLKANVRESKLQVEKARLRYEVPLLREWIHSAKKGEHPGFLGSGEYAVDVYYDLIKRRIRRIDEELEKLGKTKGQRREQRKRKGFNLISFAGYTNAGKSSLMKSLTGEEVIIEDRMFSTLSTTTKRLKGSALPILITDTIGFMHDLPPFLIEAFKNTINEIFSADLILLVVDFSEDLDEIENRIQTSEQIILPEVGLERIVLVLNKVDRVPGDEKEKKLARLAEKAHASSIILTSALTGEGLANLNDFILERFSYEVEFEVVLPQGEESERFLTWIRKNAHISHLEYDNKIRVTGLCREADLKKIENKAKGLN